MVSKKRKIQHLLWRAGLGANIETVNHYAKMPLQDVVDDWFRLSETYSSMDVVVKWKKPFTKTKTIANNGVEKKQWYNKIIYDVGQLREKMVLFWHDHFACHNGNPPFRRLYVEHLRFNALGKFEDLLLAVSKDASMIRYLNNQQNKKDSPNENFAREILELFTIGIGNYTEKDIQEAARAFTGWASNGKGQFVFRKFQHDNGEKTFMGVTGNLGGEDIIKIL
jgi:uncharacterized protein (DUF1800 family)